MSVQEKLHALFVLDQQVRGLCSRGDAAAARLRSQQLKLARLTQQRNELAEQHRQVQAKANGLEHQARDVDAKIEKLRQQMNSVRSNKEYSALLVEVNTFKLEKNKLEDEALASLGKVEGVAADLATLETQVAEQAKLTKVAETEVATAKAEVAEQLADLTRQRDAAEAAVPEDARAAFHKSCKTHDGEGLAAIIEESRRNREYTCGGCYMSIPMERVNTLLNPHRDEVVCCPNCGRILFVEQGLRQAMMKAKD